MTSASTKKRVSNRERMGRLFAAKDAEIQRLRTAMVHAMRDCEVAYLPPGDHVNARASLLSTLRIVATNLKAALEMK